MYSLELPDATILEMPVDLQFNFELQNTVFTSSDTSVLPGSFTFPVSLPITGNNSIVFKFPELPTAENPTRTIAGVWVRAHNVRMFFGELKLRKAGQFIEVSIVANPLVSLKNIALNELTLGGERTFGEDDTERRTLMAATADDPESYDFCFPQIYAPKFFNTAPDYVGNPNFGLINRYAGSDTQYALNGEPVVPMFRLDYVLSQLVINGASGWNWTNEWQNSSELKRLYIYNHYNLYQYIEGITLPDVIDPRNHVSATKGNDFLKKVAGTFCLGIFTNIFSRNIKMIPLNTVLQAPAKHDWTSYVDGQPVVEYEEADTPDYFCHPSQSGHRTFGDNVSQEFTKDLNEMTHYRTRDDLDADEGTIPDGNYYVETDEAVYYMRTLSGSGGQSRTFQKRVRACKVFGNENDFTAPMDVLLSYRVPDAAYRYLLPEWRAQGNYSMDTDTPGQYERITNDNPDAVFFYRGMQVAPGNANPIPYSSVVQDEPAGSGNCDITTSGSVVATSQHSLLWDGEYGLYEKSFRRWHEMLNTGRPVTYQLLLPIHQLINFQFQDKVRILNMEYFVRSLRIFSLTTNGYFKIEAKLFTTI